jgi:spermidine/putrescine transport system ATP-binding protein
MSPIASPTGSASTASTQGVDVELDHVTMRFGPFTAVGDAHLTIGGGEFFSFLGPSGCGKTTILRLISGFIQPTEGVVRIGGRDMTGLGPNQRPTTLIFQNLALFPLMSVAENIAFGLEARGVDKKTRRARAEELLDLIALPGVGDKKVSELSGGQRQRVAIARALAVEPQVLLLDEPLSALDLKLRQHMRAELRDLQKRTGVTFVYITHDQGEALAMSDRVAVMEVGRIEQVGTPEALYDAPNTPFVASFVGENNRFTGRVISVEGGMARIDTVAGPLVGRAGADLSVGQNAILFARPERVAVGLNGSSDGDIGPNALDAQVTGRAFEGAFAHLALTGPNGVALKAHLVGTDGAGAGPAIGDLCRVSFRPERAIVLVDDGRGPVDGGEDP